MDARADIRELLERARRGAPDAVGRIFEAARGHLLELADRELPDDLRAKLGPSDVVQETAVEMQRDFRRFTGTTAEELFVWLREMLRHNVVDAIRRYRDTRKRDVAREVRIALSESGEDQGFAEVGRLPDGSAIRREEAAIINAMLARLPSDYRRVLELRYWHGLSFVAMAPQLGRSPDAARKLWYRALERLHEQLAGVELGSVATTADDR